MEDTENILTILTSIGYAKVMCAPDTTVREMIRMAMRTVSLSSPIRLYGLELPQHKTASPDFKHVLCNDLTWIELKALYQPQELKLSICHYPTNFDELALGDRSTLFYLYHQIKETYYAKFDEIKDIEMALEIGCLEIRSVVSSPAVKSEDLFELVEKVRSLSSFFPPCVIRNLKGKLKRSVQSHMIKIVHYTEVDCVLDMLNRFLILLRFDRDLFRCVFGAGYGIPAQLVIGPRFQASIKTENARQPRPVATFKSIRQILVTRVPRNEEDRYTVRLMVASTTDGPREMINFTFESRLAADVVVHLLQGYCPEHVDETDNSCNTSEKVNDVNWRLDLLSNGCPYRFDPRVAMLLLFDPGLDIGVRVPTDNKNGTIQREKIELEHVLGEGQFGDVYKGLLRKTIDVETIPVAIKTCKPDCLEKGKQPLLDEASILREFTHPHIVRLIGVCEDSPLWLVMEYAPLGELRHYLLTNQAKIPASLRITYCYQISTALTHLESRRCLHRDIAARNILVAREDCVKLSDFGMAVFLRESDEIVEEKGGKIPIKWLPPESIHHRRFSRGSDVWMFGICIWEILSGGLKPFPDSSNAEAVDLITQGHRLKRPPLCPQSLYNLLLECWKTNSLDRPTFSFMKPILRELAVEVTMTTESKNGSGDVGARSNNSGSSSTTLPDSSNARSRWNEVTEWQSPHGAYSSDRVSSTSSVGLASTNAHRSSNPFPEHNDKRASDVDDFEPSTWPRSAVRCDFDGRFPSFGNLERNSPDCDSKSQLRINQSSPLTTASDKSNDCLQEPVYLATATVIRTVHLVTQQLKEANVNEFAILIKEQSGDKISVWVTSRSHTTQSIGAAVKNVLVAVDTTLEANCTENEILLAHRQLKASICLVISTVKESNLENNRGPVFEEFRRTIMSQAFAVAHDAKMLYETIYAWKQKYKS